MPMCCAIGCTSRAESGKRLFAIPSGLRDGREVARRKLWLRRIGRANFKATHSARLCEDHFTEDQYEPIVLQKHGIKKLKPNATPTIFNHKSSHRQPALRIQTSLLPGGATLLTAAPGQERVKAAAPQNGTENLPTAAAHQECDPPPSSPKSTLPVTSDTFFTAYIEATPPQRDTELSLAPAYQEEGPGGSPCLVCDQPVTFLCEFLSDVHNHRTPVSKKFVCGHCLQVFTKYNDLMAHITGIGSDLKFRPNGAIKVDIPRVTRRPKFPCSHCGAVFETSSARFNHTVVHTTAIQAGLSKALKRNPRTVGGAPGKGAQQDRLKDRPRRGKIPAEDPSQICADSVPKPAPQPKMVVKVVATSECSPRKRQRKILAPRFSEISQSVPVVPKQPQTAGKKLDDASSHPGKQQTKVSAPCPSKTRPSVPVVQERPQKTVKEVANAGSVKTELITFSSLPKHQKQRILSTVYCNHCDLQFATLRLLDRHYWLCHSHLDFPLDLMFEVGSGEVAPAASPCSACVKRTECVKTLSRLLEEASSEGES